LQNTIKTSELTLLLLGDDIDAVIWCRLLIPKLVQT